MDVVGPYILLRVHFSRNIDGIGGVGPYILLRVHSSRNIDGIGRHRTLHTLKSYFSRNIDGIGPYILLRVIFFQRHLCFYRYSVAGLIAVC